MCLNILQYPASLPKKEFSGLNVKKIMVYKETLPAFFLWGKKKKKSSTLNTN